MAQVRRSRHAGSDPKPGTGEAASATVPERNPGSAKVAFSGAMMVSLDTGSSGVTLARMSTGRRPPGYLTEDLHLQVSGPARYTSRTEKPVEHITLTDGSGAVIGYLYANDDDDAAGWVPRATATPEQQNLASPWMMLLLEAKTRGIRPSAALDELLSARPSNQSRAIAARQTAAGLEALRQLAAS
jgi:hypothetical protein